jgi:hypothetical protein
MEKSSYPGIGLLTCDAFQRDTDALCELVTFIMNNEVTYTFKMEAENYPATYVFVYKHMLCHNSQE